MCRIIGDAAFFCITILSQGVLMRKLIIALLLVSASLHARRQDPDRPIKGETFLVEKMRISNHELTDILAQRNKKLNTQSRACPPNPPADCPPCPAVPPFGVTIANNPNALPGAFFPNISAINLPVPPPQTIGTNFLVKIGSETPTFLGTPGNPGVCVGPSQVILNTVQGFVEFDRQGNRGNFDVELNTISNADMDFTNPISTQEIQTRYDKFTNRLVFGMDLFAASGNNADGGMVIGISDSGNIDDNTQWTIVNIYGANALPDATGCPGDQNNDYDSCRCEVDKNAIYIAFDIFNEAAPFFPFTSSSAFVIQKESLINEGPAVITTFRDVIGFPGDSHPYRDATYNLTPVLNLDEDAPFGYYIAQDPQFWGKLVLFRVINPGSTAPTLSPGLPLDVPQTGMLISGTTLAPFLGNLYGELGVLALIDDRLYNAHMRDKQLYTSHNILVDRNGVGTQSGDRCAARWYQIDVTGDSSGNGANTETATTLPVLVQAGTLFDSSATNPLFYYMPSVMTNKNHDLTLCGTLSGVNQPTTAFFTGRVKSDPLGTLRVGATLADITLALGGGPFTRSLGLDSATGFYTTTFGQRWGDWSYTAFDPVGDLDMWTVQEIALNGLTQVVIAQLQAP